MVTVEHEKKHGVLCDHVGLPVLLSAQAYALHIVGRCLWKWIESGWIVQPRALWPPHQSSRAGGGFCLPFPQSQFFTCLEEGAEGGTGSGREATQKIHFPG